MALPYLRDLLLNKQKIGLYFEPKPGIKRDFKLGRTFKFTNIQDAVDIYKQYCRDRFRNTSRECGLKCCVFGVNEFVDHKTSDFVYVVPNGHQQRMFDRAFDDLNAAQIAIDNAIAAAGKQALPNYFDGPGGLYDFVENVIGKMKNIGPLTVYDSAIRIGQNLSLVVEPKRFVYMPSFNGPLDGAKKFFALIGKPVPNLLKNPNRFDVSHFSLLTSPPYSLTPLEIEDMLCVFHNHF